MGSPDSGSNTGSGLMRYNTKTASWELDESVADQVVKEQAKEPQKIALDRDRASSIDLLKRLGVQHQEACLVTSDEFLKPTRAIQAADAFMAHRGPQDAGGRKKTIAVFAGPVGVGKTTAAAYLLANGRPKRITGAWTARESPMFTHVDSVFASSKLIGEADQKARKGYEKPQILVIDDVGLERDPRGMFQPYFDWLINARYAGEGWLVITTNLPAEEFRRRYKERIYDRLRQRAEWYEISHPSLRTP